MPAPVEQHETGRDEQRRTNQGEQRMVRPDSEHQQRRAVEAEKGRSEESESAIGAAGEQHRLPHRATAAGKHDERRVGRDADVLDAAGFVEDLRAAKLDDIFAGISLDPRASQRLAFEIGQRGGRLDVERYCIPHIRDGYSHRETRAHTERSAGAGSVERNRSTAWSKRSVEPRTLVPSGPLVAAIAISSPPWPRNTRKFEPSFSG